MSDYEDKKNMTKPFTLFNNETGQSFEIPVLNGSEGPSVLDIRSLYKDTGMFTYDPGYTSTASCTSSITYIDGHKGILKHRGYDIKDLANHSNFIEVCYLLLHANLPSPVDKKKFEKVINSHRMLHEQLVNFYRGFRRDAHPMAIMVGVVGALSSFYHDSTDFSDITQRMIASNRLIAKSQLLEQWHINTLEVSPLFILEMIYPILKIFCIWLFHYLQKNFLLTIS